MRWVGTMDTTEEAKVNEDVDALKDDIRRVRDDLASAVRSLRGRAKHLAADSRYRIQTMVPGQRRKPSVEIETAETGQTTMATEYVAKPRRRYYQRMPGWFPASLRVMGGAFALGMIATLLVLWQRKMIFASTRPERERKRSKFGAVRAWVRGLRGRKSSWTETYEPTDWERGETAVHRESRFEERPVR